ncbi:MAG: fibronectin type III domain-containing protein, partial [Methylosarcina sp.]
PLATVVSDVRNETSIMYQACGEWKNKTAWSWCYWANNDTPDIGIGFGYNNFNTTYFEIYQADLMNEAYASQFQKWHDTLKPYLP